MIGLRILVEGDTEEGFVNNVLALHLVSFDIECVAARVTTRRRPDIGMAHKGGCVEFHKVKSEIMAWMKQEPDAWVTTMFDLYRLSSDFPDFAQAAGELDPHKRVEGLEEAFLNEVVDDTYWRFVPYIQVHEYEALLFSNLSKLGEWDPGFPKEIEALNRSVSCFPTPEHIDDGLETAPSKRIVQFFPRYKKEKAVVGPVVAEAIGLEQIRSQCGHFGQWLEKLEKLAAPR